MPELKIVVFTYKRNDELLKCVKSIFDSFKNIKEPPTVVILDNSPEGEALQVANSIGFDNIEYSFCGEKNIAAARNHALFKLGVVEWQSWIDDDEFVSDDWYENVLNYIAHDSSAAAYVGFVETVYNKFTPSWLKKSRVFDRKRPIDLERVSKGGAGNLIVNVSRVKKSGVKFDLAYGTTGGEDSKFLLDLNVAGEVVLSAPNCVAYEELSESRSNIAYIMKRAFRGGQTHYILRVKGKSFWYRSFNFFQKNLEVLFLFVLLLCVFSFSRSYAAVILKRLSANFGQLVARYMKIVELYK